MCEITDKYFSSQSSTQIIYGTQELSESQNLDLSIIEEKPWGRLLSLHRTTKVFNLTNESYSFGRGNVDYQFTPDVFPEKIMSVLSKLHFVITREIKSNEDSVVIIEDKSQNGTFINKILIGKNKKKVLQNNDTISLAQLTSKAFVFYDCLKNDSKEYPDVLNSKYVVMKKIGCGAYGEVRLAYSEDSLNRVAIKIIKKKHCTEEGSVLQLNNIAKINNEINLLKSAKHPYIVQLYDFIESEDRIFLIMELAEGGELFERITGNGKLNEPVAKLYFYQLVNAVAYLHKLKITHRDIKPENILLASDDEFTTVKLTDFGLSKLTQDTSLMTTFCGSKMYIAPELLSRETPYTNKVDMWSLGVVLFACLAGYFPFPGNDDVERYNNIKKGKFNMKEPVWNEVSEDVKDLIRKLLAFNPCERISASEALKHKWLQDSKMLKKANHLLKRNQESKLFSKRPLESDDLAYVDSKTPKLMSGVEVNLNVMETD